MFPVAGGALLIADFFEPPDGIENSLGNAVPGIEVAVVVFKIKLFGKFPPFV